ncbi:MAG: hypothetical protein J6M95_02680 [Bacilli bacterium]|nr:hypothetical protein [Bacilli bacterium]
MKKYLALSILPLLITGCGNNSSNSASIDQFYTSLFSYNWEASSEVGTFQFISENELLISYKDNEGISGGFINNGDGVYEYVIIDNVLEIEGMYSPNPALKTYEFINSPADIRYIDKSFWKSLGNGKYSLELEKLDETGQYGAFYGFGFDLLGSVKSINSVELTLTKESATFESKYNVSGSRATKTSTLTINNFGEYQNEIISSYLQEHPHFEKQTDWTNLQKQKFNEFGIPDPYFYSGYSEGLYLYLGYANSYGIIIAYDSKSSPEHVASLSTELVNQGFAFVSEDSGIKRYEKNNIETKVNQIVEFSFLSVDDLNDNDKICYPSGYLQVVYSYKAAHETISIERLNGYFSEVDIKPFDDPNGVIEEITITDTTEEYNEYVTSTIIESGYEVTGDCALKQLEINIKIADFETAHSYVEYIYNTVLKDDFINDNAACADLLGEEYTGEREIVFEELTSSGYEGTYSVICAKIYGDNEGLNAFQIYDYEYNITGSITILIEIYSKEAVAILF